MTKQKIDRLLARRLADLADQANLIGAEGIWIIRGAQNANLSYEIDPGIPPFQINGVPAATNMTINFHIADAGVIVLIRFPASDGGEPGIESK